MFLVVGTSLEAVFVNDFDFIINAKFGKFLAHESGVFVGSAIDGGWGGGGERFGKCEVCWTEFDIEEFSGGGSDGVSVLAK